MFAVPSGAVENSTIEPDHENRSGDSAISGS
jgi:hypothetical protein